MPKEETLNQRYLYKGKKITLRLDEVRYVSGNTGERAIIEHPGAVTMVPLSAAGEVYFVRQYRPATGKILLELPAGTRELGEEPLTTATRELQEEIGYLADSFTLLSEFYTAPGFCNEYMYLYLAQGLQPSRLTPPEDEDISVVKMTLPEAFAAIERKEIIDAKSLVGLHLAQQFLSKDKK